MTKLRPTPMPLPCPSGNATGAPIISGVHAARRLCDVRHGRSQSLASLLLAEAGPAAAALLPLSEQMLWQHFGDAVPPANSGYGRQRRRRMEALPSRGTSRQLRPAQAAHVNSELTCQCQCPP